MQEGGGGGGGGLVVGDEGGSDQCSIGQHSDGMRTSLRLSLGGALPRDNVSGPGSNPFHVVSLIMIIFKIRRLLLTYYTFNQTH